MPAAIPIIVGALATEFIGASVLAAALTIGSALAVGAYEKRRAERKARDAFNDSLQDRNVTIRSAISPREYILGTRRTGGTLVYAESLGPKKEYLDTVTAFAANRCDLIGYYLGDEFVPVGGELNKKYGKKTLVNNSEFKVVGTVNGSATFDLVEAPYTDTTFSSTGPFGINFYVPLPANSTVAVATQNGKNYALGISSIIGNTITVSGLPFGNSVVKITYPAVRYQAIALGFNQGDANQQALQFGTTTTGVELNQKWTPEHRLRGIAHSRVNFGYDEDAYFSGAPSIGALLRGMAPDGAPYVDTRGLVTIAFTDNPALLAYWYMTLPRAMGGCGIPSAWIDVASVNTAANICDELITVKKLDNSGTEQIKRYQCNCILSTDVPPLNNLDIILSAMAGKRVFTAGKYKIFAGAFRSAIVTLTDSDVIGDRPITADPSGGDDTPPNVVTASFIDAAKDYTQTSPNPIINLALIISDGYEEPIDINLPATTDARQANYLMGVALQSSRPAYSIQLSVGGIGENLALGDCVQLNLVNRSVYANRTFEIVGYTDNWDGTFALVLSEIKASTWALDLNTFTPINQGTKENLDYLWRVMPLVNFQAVPVSVQTLRDGSTLARVRISWAPITDPFVLTSGKVEIRYKDALDDNAQYITVATARTDETSVTIDANLVDGNIYQFEGRIVNGVGAASYWIIDYSLFSGNRVDTKFIARGNCRATDLSFRKVGGVTAWDSDVYSIDGHEKFHMQWKSAPGSEWLFGANSDPEVSQSWETMDYAFCGRSGGNIEIFESAVQISPSVGTYNSSTEFGVSSDGVNLGYYINRNLVRAVARPAGVKYFLDSSFLNPGASINSIIFGPGPDFEDYVIGTRDIADQAISETGVTVQPADGSLNYPAGNGGPFQLTGLNGSASYTAPQGVGTTNVLVSWASQAAVSNATGGNGGLSHVVASVSIQGSTVFTKRMIMDGSNVFQPAGFSGSRSFMLQPGQQLTLTIATVRSFQGAGSTPAQTHFWGNTFLNISAFKR